MVPTNARSKQASTVAYKRLFCVAMKIVIRGFVLAVGRAEYRLQNRII